MPRRGHTHFKHSYPNTTTQKTTPSSSSSSHTTHSQKHTLSLSEMPAILRNMKSSIDIFCTSPSSTAICSSTDPYTTTTISHPNYHRHHNHHYSYHSNHHRRRLNSYIQDQYKTLSSSASSITNNCLSDQFPITPSHTKTSNPNFQITHPSTGSRKSAADVTDLILQRRPNTHRRPDFLIRRSPSGGSSRYLLLDDVNDDIVNNDKDNNKLLGSTTSASTDDNHNKLAIIPSEPVVVVKQRDSNYSDSHKKKRDLDYLRRRRLQQLSTTTTIDDDEFDRLAAALVVSQPIRNKESGSGSSSSSRGGDHRSRSNSSKSDFAAAAEAVVNNKSSPPAPSVQTGQTLVRRQQQKVAVVLRVSLHCKGCAAKLGKHLSKMEGVTSFNIELESKKVTVVGKVLNPIDILTNVSKVKKSEFWPSSSSVSSSSSLERSEYFSY